MNDKKYYWIRLKTNFFSQEIIDFLLSQKNGCQYVVLYQMLCLNTANSDGALVTNINEMLVPYDINKIVRDTKYFDFDTVSVALELFKKLGLIYEEQDGILKITNYSEMVGSESGNANAQRQKRFRERKKQELLSVTENNVTSVTDSVTENNEEYRDKSIENRDIDIKETLTNVSVKKCSEQDVKENDNESPEVAKPKAKKPKKNKYGDYSHVLLTEEEYLKLHKDYPNADEIIQYLDSYIEEKGYKANSHYLSIKRWVVNAVKEDNRRSKGNRYTHTKSLPPYMNDNGEVDIPPKEEASDEDKQKAINELNSLMKVLHEN